MGKKQNTTPKQPKTVQVKLLVPYALLALLLVSSIAFIAGFHTNQQLEHGMRQEFANGVASVKTQQ